MVQLDRKIRYNRKQLKEEQLLKLPEKFVEKYQRLLGDEGPAFLASFDQPSQSGFRINPLKATPQATIDRSTGKVPYVPTGD